MEIGLEHRHPCVFLRVTEGDSMCCRTVSAPAQLTRPKKHFGSRRKNRENGKGLNARAF